MQWALRGIVGLFLLCLLFPMCGCKQAAVAEPPEMIRARIQMVADLAKTGQITDKRVLAALRQVPRQVFFEPGTSVNPYSDVPVVGGPSSVLVVARALQELGLREKQTLLVVNPPDAYAAAVGSRLCERVFVLVMLQPDADRMRRQLRDAGIDNVHIEVCDISEGWPSGAPYDGVIVYSATGAVERAIVEQCDRQCHVVVLSGPWASSMRVMRVQDEELVDPRIVQVGGRM